MVKNITKNQTEISSHEEINIYLFTSFSNLFKENQKLPEHHIVEYHNTINALKTTEELFSECDRSVSENEILQALSS